jgi:hypothetical protein
MREVLIKSSNLLNVRITISVLMQKENVLKLTFSSSVDQEVELDQFLGVKR